MYLGYISVSQPRGPKILPLSIVEETEGFEHNKYEYLP